MVRLLASLSLRTTALAALLLTVGGGAGWAQQQRVGVNSAVNPDANGTPPGAPTRRLVLGQEVVYNERINTAAAGQTQVLFLDESSMSIGPNSDLTIDQFVYDPNSGTGKLAMSATRGVLRFVGGKLSKQENAVSVKTPTATIAVRGGAFLMNQAASGSLEVIFIYGTRISVTGLTGAFEQLVRPGWAVTVAGPGALPSAAFPVPPGRLATLLAQLDGRTGGNGGAPQVPTDATVAASGLPQVLSNNFQTSIQAANQNAVTTPGQTPQVSVSNLQSNLQVNTVQGQSATQSLTNGSGAYSGVYRAGSFPVPDQTSAGNMPFSNGALGSNGFRAPLGANQQVSFPASPGSTTFTAQGTSPDGPLSGTSFVTPDGSFLYANANGAMTGQQVFVSAGNPVPASVLAPTGQTRVQAFDVASAPSPVGSSIPFLLNDDGGYSQRSISPLYLVAPATSAIGDTSGSASARTAQASLAVDGSGSSQLSAIAVQTGVVRTLQSSGQPIISGVFRGAETESSTGAGSEIYAASTSSIVDKTGSSIYGRNSISGFALDQTQYQVGSNGMATTAVASTANETEGVTTSSLFDQYGFAQPAVATTLPKGVGANRTTQTLNGYFGGQMYTTATGGSYPITGTTVFQTDAGTNAVNASFLSDQLSQTQTGGIQKVTLNFGGQQSAFVDDQTFVATENPQANQFIDGKTAQNPLLYLASSGAVAPPAGILPAGASYCQCQYLQWGYWGGDLTTGGSPGTPRVDHGHINFWTAGPVTPQVDLNTLASQNFTGTYNGHAIGSVVNNGSSYIAGGGFQGTYNFATQNGNFAINNFDGRNFAASGSAPLSNGQYTFAINTSGATGAIKGGFFGPMAAETGGNFAVQVPGVSYSAAGIFAGKR